MLDRAKSIVIKTPARRLADFADLANGEMREEFEARRRRNKRRFQAMLERFETQWLQEDRDRLCEWAQAISEAGGQVGELNAVELRSLLCRAIEGQDPTTVRSILAVVVSDPDLKKQIGCDLEACSPKFPEIEPTRREPDLVFSRDYRSCRWRTHKFEFTPTQAAMMEALYEEWSRGTPALAQETILDCGGSNASKLRDVFRGHPALNLLIVPGKSSGTWRLAPDPPSHS